MSSVTKHALEVAGFVLVVSVLMELQLASYSLTGQFGVRRGVGNLQYTLQFGERSAGRVTRPVHTPDWYCASAT